KIVATIGPASDSPESVAKLIQAGVAVFRINFSHGTLADHERRVAIIRDTAHALGKPTAILGDLQGPKIRVGELEHPITLERGQEVLFHQSSAFTSEISNLKSEIAHLPSDHPDLATEVLPGHRVLINDGAVRLLAVDREPGDPAGVLRCRVTVGGLVSSRKGINLPDSDVQASAITDQDWQHVEWAVAHNLDFLALSFVRKPEEVIELRKALMGMCPVDLSEGGTGSSPASGVVHPRPHAHQASHDHTSRIPIIAKIEKPQALDRIDEILEAADGIMVARGDLGVEMDLAEVPLVQKRLISKCDEFGKPCIVATQMLESMIESPSPTRAEVSDVANAILDGADAVMLSAETAIGKYPVVAVETMRRVIAAAERKLADTITAPSPGARLIKSRYRTAALAHGAWHVARDIGAKLIACWSQEGGTARYLSQTGPNIPIIAYSSDIRQVRRMSLLRGVTPRHMPLAESTGGTGGSSASDVATKPYDPSSPPQLGLTLSEWNARVELDLLTLGLVIPGDPIILVAGKPLGTKGATCSLAVHYTGNRHTGYMRS
nr:pyruvate kinase [Phycisphaerales bacterium]